MPLSITESETQTLFKAMPLINLFSLKIVKSPTSRGQNPNYIQGDPTLPRRHPPTFPDILVFVFVFVHVFVIVFVSSMS